jgi:hypothetical protein
LAAVALSLGIVSPKLTPLDTQPPMSKSDILIAAAANDNEPSSSEGSESKNSNS